MTTAEQRDIVGALLARYDNRSLAEQAEIRMDTSPHLMFQLLELAALTDGRVDPAVAVRTFVTLRSNRLTTAGHVRSAGTERISGILHDAGYPEGDVGRITTAISDTALHLEEDHGGDLGELREDVGRDPERERETLRHFAAVDDRVIDAFCRDAQLLWEELRPFADKKALDAATRLDLGEDAETLRSLVRDDRAFVRLVDALVQIRHERDGYQRVRETAGQR